jgi:hypothetical protein
VLKLRCMVQYFGFNLERPGTQRPYSQIGRHNRQVVRHHLIK